MKFFKEYIDFTINMLQKYSLGRQIVIWGYYDFSKEVKDELISSGLDVAFFIDSDYRKVINNYDCKEISSIHSLNNKYYVYIPLRFHKEIYAQLDDLGYVELDDFFYNCHEPITLSGGRDYADKYGNRIIGSVDNIKIVFKGYNSTIRFKNNLGISNGNITVYSNADVEFGKNFSMNDADLKFSDGCRCKIGSAIQNGIIIASPFSKINIGDQSTMCFNYYIVVYQYTELVIGNDCMFSHDIMIRTNDGHTIQSLNKNEINEEENKKIVIGNHVWLGAKSTVLYNTEIGDGSIVGTGSIVKGKFPNNCTLAGIPAKIIKQDVEWFR